MTTCVGPKGAQRGEFPGVRSPCRWDLEISHSFPGRFPRRTGSEKLFAFTGHPNESLSFRRREPQEGVPLGAQEALVVRGLRTPSGQRFVGAFLFSPGHRSRRREMTLYPLFGPEKRPIRIYENPRGKKRGLHSDPHQRQTNYRHYALPLNAPLLIGTIPHKPFNDLLFLSGLS